MTRRRKSTIPIMIDAGGVETEIDIGLVDILVEFTPSAQLPVLPTGANLERSLQESWHHLDLVCKGVFHDQMILAAAPHFYLNDGSLRFHYHNLVFGLRQQVRGDMDFSPPLTWSPC